MILKDQILYNAFKRLSDYQSEKNIFKLDLEEVITLADNYVSIHPGGVTTRVAGDKNLTSHQRKYNQWDGPLLGSEARDQRSSYGPKSTENEAQVPGKYISAVKCFRCQEQGHIARFCTNPENRYTKCNVKQLRSFSSNLRFDCENLHIGSVSKEIFVSDNNLHVKFGKLNNYSNVRVLRDTGCSIMIVNESLISAKDRVKGTILLKFTNNQTMEVSKTSIYLSCPHYTGRTVAAILKDSPYDIILGNLPNVKYPCGNSDSVNYGSYVSPINAVQTRHQSSKAKSENAMTRSVLI